MGLDATVRSAVAAAAAAVADLLVNVGHEPWASTDSDGKHSYGASVTRKAFVMSKSMPLFRLIGVESLGGESALFVGNVAVDERDRITLPNGTKPRITSVEGVTDPAGGTFYTWVKFERPDRGTLSS